MMSLLTDPVFALFVSLGLGHLIGKLRIGPIAIGGVCGTLFVALALGQLSIQVPEELKNTAFALFIYALGFTAGPQFFANLRGGARFAVFPVIEITVSLALTLAAVRLLSLDPGMAAGIFAGSATESAVVGTASEAIAKLGLPAQEAQQLQAHIATAYSLTYLFGLVAIVFFVTQIAPLLVRKNLQAEASALARELGDEGTGEEPGLPIIVERAFQAGSLVGQSVRQFEEARNWTAVVSGAVRNGETIPVDLNFIVQPDDIIILRGRRNTVMAAGRTLGTEIPVPLDAGFAAVSRQVVLSNRRAFGKAARDLREMVATEAQRGIFITQIRRMGNAVPALPKTVLQQGDVLTLHGPQEAVDNAVTLLGHPLPPEDSTDFVMLGLGIIVGLVIGHLSVRIGAVDLTLGTGGGALIAGLLFGWLNMRHPRYAALPDAAAHFAKDFGLAAFIAAIGLGAGPDAIALIREYGLVFPLLGILLSTLPALVSLVVGWRLMRLPLPILLGAIAGQHCSTPAISALVSQAGNSTPVIGYTVTYAIGNVLLPLMGPIVVALAIALSG